MSAMHSEAEQCAVDRCVCRDVTFAEMLDLHRSEGLDVAQIKERTGAGHTCRRCGAFIHLTLATGRTAHPAIGVRAFAAARRFE